jgi:hypothetical protein
MIKRVERKDVSIRKRNKYIEGKNLSTPLTRLINTIISFKYTKYNIND